MLFQVKMKYWIDLIIQEVKCSNASLHSLKSQQSHFTTWSLAAASEFNSSKTSNSNLPFLNGAKETPCRMHKWKKIANV